MLQGSQRARFQTEWGFDTVSRHPYERGSCAVGFSRGDVDEPSVAADSGVGKPVIHAGRDPLNDGKWGTRGDVPLEVEGHGHQSVARHKDDVARGYVVGIGPALQNLIKSDQAQVPASSRSVSLRRIPKPERSSPQA